MNFKVELLLEAEKFIDSLETKARIKVFYNLRKSQEVNDTRILKKLNKYIWEFRTLYKGNSIRLFAFWDKRDKSDVLVICSHGIIKKTNQTPKKEISKADNIRKQYLNY